MLETQPTGSAAVRGLDVPLIDCDVHSVVPSVDALLPYLSDFWREYIAQSAFKGPPEDPYPPKLPTSIRPDARRPDGPPPGSSLADVRAGALDPWGVERAILNCAYGIESIHNPDAAAALAAAVVLSEWLTPLQLLAMACVTAASVGATRTESAPEVLPRD